MHFAKTIVFALSLTCLCGVQAGLGQTEPRVAAASSDKAAAYYNFAMGHLYAELAAAYGNRGDYYSKAIDYLKQAQKLDPSANFLLEELSELYVQGNQWKAAVTEAEDALKQNPDNLQARRILGRIYTRFIGDSDKGKINEEMVRRAIEQYQHITAKDPADAESWITLGRLQRVAQNSVEAEKAFKKVLEKDADNEDALTGLAMVYSDVGDTKNMVEMLRRVSERSPSARTLSTLGTAYEQMRDYRHAAEVYRRALSMGADNPQVKRALAQSLLYSDNYDEALKLYEELAEAEPKDAALQLRLSEIYRQRRDFAKARAALNKAKAEDANNLEVRYDEVNLLDAEGKTDEAIAVLRKMLDDTVKKSYTANEKSSRTMMLERLAGLQREARQYPKAIETLRQITAVDPDAGPRVAASVVETYRMAKDLPKAQEEAEAAIKKFPDDRLVKVIHANVLADVGKVDEAASEVRSLLKGNKDRETLVTLAQIYEKGKKFQEMGQALDEAEKISQSDQDKESVYFMRGAMYEKMKKYAEAEAEFRKVLAVNPQSASALNYLGYMLADRNVRLEEATELIRKALQIDPQNGAYLDSLGWVYYRQNKLEEAEANLRQSIERTEGDPTVHDHLGDVYLQQGKLKDAIAQWQLSLKEWERTPQSDIDPAEMAEVSRKLEGARIRLAKEGGQAK